MKSSIISTIANEISSGGSITGDLTISGDLTVSGGGSFTYEEVIDGSLGINDYIYHNGDTNTYIGFSALDTFRVRTGGTNRLMIDNNSRISLSNNDLGAQNTVFGYDAGANIVSGADYNVFIGYQAGDAVTTDDTHHNVGVGYSALGSLTSGDENTCIGSNSGFGLTSGSDSVALGRNALKVHTTGDRNIAIGYGAMDDTDATAAADGGAGGTPGTLASVDNVFIGYDSGGGTWAGSDSNSNVAIGNYSMDAAMDGALNNTAVGYNGLSELTAGVGNVAVGYGAGDAITVSSSNIAIGYNALSTETTGEGTTAIGNQALLSQIKGDANSTQNTAIGNGAGQFVTTATGTTYVGFRAGKGITGAKTTGIDNTAVGNQAGLLLQGAAHENTFLGSYAGDVLTTGSDNTCIGKSADTDDATAVNQTVIGHSTTGQADNSVTLGNDSVDAVYMASNKAATVYCDKIAVGAGITQHSTTHLDVQGSIRAGCGSGDSGSTQAGQLMGLAGTIEGDNTVRLLKASMTSEGSLWVVSGYQVGTSNRFADLLLAYSGGVAVVSAQNTNSPDTRTYSIVAEALKLLINVTDSGEETYQIRMTGIGGNELAASTAPTMGGA